MKQLTWFLGQWNVVSRTRNADGDWIEEPATTDHTAILGGHAIFEHFRGTMSAKTFEAWSLRKYNPQTNQWEQRWVDTTPGGFADWTGSWRDEKGEFIGHPNRVLNEGEAIKDEAAREVFFDITDDHFSWKYERTSDAGETWEIAWTLDYTRTGRKGDPA